MCGITGFVQTSPRLGEQDLARMTDALVRRGPDDAGYFQEEGVGLGMRRLSIIDLEGGRQPVFSESGRFAAVFNGEIYNYRALQDMLRGKGYTFRSNGDGEVIVNLYEHCGPAAFNQLRGMFAVAIWDRRDKVMVLVRDQLGIKPLFYSRRGDALLFGSEIKSLLAAIPESLPVDAQALDALFAYTYIPAPLTIWKDVRKLEPGHWLQWQHGKVSIQRYWDLLDAPAEPSLSVAELREALDDSVRAHLVSDVEVGAFLSGGLDSSTIVARMQTAMQDKLRAFSVRFDTRSHLFDETGYARELQQRYGFNLQVENLPASGYEAIGDVIRAFDEPFADDSIMPNHAICEMAARHLKVVLSGAGGDEFFGGYNRYQGVVVHQRLAALPGWVRERVASPALHLLARLRGPGTRHGDLARRFAADLHRSTDDAYLSYVTAAPADVRRSLLAAEVADRVDPAATRALVADHLERASGLAPLKRALYADVKTYLPEDVLALSDRVGMWHSLEIRTPLADRALAETAFRLRPDELVGLRQKKVALRRAVAPWLPESILAHPKQGFEGPTASWFRGEGAATLRTLLKQQHATGPALVRQPYVETLLEEHQAGSADHAKRLFSVLAVATWAQLNAGRIGAVR